MKAIWNNEIIAESDKTISVEGNHYFPVEAVRKEFLKPSDKYNICPWKGTASYYTLLVNCEENKDAAWFYPYTKPVAKQIENYIAFWKGVEVKK